MPDKRPDGLITFLAENRETELGKVPSLSEYKAWHLSSAQKISQIAAEKTILNVSDLHKMFDRSISLLVWENGFG